MSEHVLGLIREARETVATELDLSHQGLTQLPARLWGPTGLLEPTWPKSLKLCGNQFTTLPSAIGQLTGLQELNLSDNRLTVLPPEIGQLTELQELNLNRNRLTALPPEIGLLAALQVLGLDSNQLIALPAEVGQLAALRSLYLDLNRLTELPLEIGRLTHLQRLDLLGNQLTVLPAELQGLQQLKELYLHDNPALAIPPEVLGPRWDEDEDEDEEVGDRYGYRGGDRYEDGYGRVYSKTPAKPSNVLGYYFKSVREGSRPLLEAKLLILGQGAVGKTSLVKRLVDGTFDLHQQKTDGIDIAHWTIPGKDNQEIRVNIWDFGGQEIMHATHQFFLTKRSLYIVVLDARKGENEGNVFYWLRIIESYGGDSPVLVVTNKCEGACRLDLDEYRLKKDYPSIRAFFNTSCRKGIGIEELKNAINEQVQGLGHVYDRVPKSFLETKANLEEQTESKDYLELREYRKICQGQGIDEREDQDLLLRFLHDLGVVLHFADPDSLYRLDETNILNPRWVTNGVYKILNDPQLAKRGGALGLRDVNRILRTGEGYPKNARLFVLGMMERFELCFEGFKGKRGYLVPELLPKNEPELELEESDILRFEYNYEFLPEGLLPRFIVRMHSHLKGETVWRRGVLVDIEGNEALVRGDLQAGRIYISVFGSPTGRRRALTVIRTAFQAIHRTIPGLQGEEMIPLPDNPGQTESYEHLLLLEDNGVHEHWPKGAKRAYQISELIDGIETAEDREERAIAAILQEIAEALAKRREELEGQASDSENTPKIIELEEVEKAAKDGKPAKVRRWLKRGGKWTYDEARGMTTDALVGVITNLIRGY